MPIRAHPRPEFLTIVRIVMRMINEEDDDDDDDDDLMMMMSPSWPQVVTNHSCFMISTIW